MTTTPAAARRLPFTVIGGYLGAGKTTLLNHVLSHAAGRRLAVLVNDFGSLNVDAALIRRHDGDTITLAGGCMCCSLAGGFATAFGQILDRRGRFDHVVIEASGVADPAKIARYGKAYGLPLDGIVVVVDAERVRSLAADRYVGDTVVRQVRQADLLVVNKTDLVAAADLDGVRAWLAGLAPGVKRIETRQSQVAVDLALGTHHVDGPSDAAPAGDDATAHARVYGTWTVERTDPVSRHGLEHFARGLGADVYRAKGFVRLQEDPERCYLFQHVGRRWSLEPGAEWGDEPRRTRIVVIGRTGATDVGPLEALLEDAPSGPFRVEVTGT